jgi:beta-phosphoglucomutase-like phosphatase (HAD superfamily)
LRASSQIYCSRHWAEYQRDYHKERTTVAFLDGVDACVRLLREQIGDRSTTGRQAAQLLARLGAGEESPEQMQRRQLIENLRPKGAL